MRQVEDRFSAFDRSEGRRGILLDFDGTLSPIVARPELAQIRDGARQALARLVPRYSIVAIVSGRTPSQLRELVQVEGVVLAGFYGLGDEASTVPQEVTTKVIEAAAHVPGARFEPKGGSLAVHYRGADDPVAAEGLLTGLLAPIARDANMELLAGKKVLELVPAGHPLKQGAIERIVAEYRLDAVLFAGDDLADIGAFGALDRLAAGGVQTVKVAVHGPETPESLLAAADLVVDGPAGLVGLLRRL